MSASVSANVDQSYSYDSGSQNEAYKTQKYFFGGLLGQLGAGTDSAKTVNCYAAGKIFDPSSGKRNLFMGSVLGYSMSNVNDYFYDANTQLTAYCMNGVSFTEGSSRFIGGQGSELLTRNQEKQYQNNASNNYGQGYYQTKIYGLQSVGLDQLKPTGSAASTIPLNTYLSGSYPLLTWTRLYTPAEILGGSGDVSAAPLRYIGDWCLN